ncbi:MAG TPA: adenylate/guanylate cyclase domain-containing protein [Gemmatimonadaceae bacterium]|nr:adenylate/guanylate cyclase domain-containing protein [Gemmatimonadaceae bacterium]
MPYQLISADRQQRFELRTGCSLVVGRSASSDIPLLDPAISRRHARLDCDDAALQVHDLGSSNGTFVNGERVESARVESGDTLAFGHLAFQVHAVEAPAPSPNDAGAIDSHRTPEVTIVRQRPIKPISRAPRASRSGETTAEPLPTGALPAERASSDEMLALLLEVSKELSRVVDLDALLDKIAGFVFQTVDADRVSILLAGDDGTMVPKFSRDRAGTAAERMVPRSIAQRVVEEEVAVLTDNAREDDRFGGQSIVRQRVRSAMCAPLLGSEEHAQGVLYVDNVTTTQRFTDVDLDLLVALSGMAAVAIENHRFSERSRREALVRSNFERYFAPSLAARIAGAPEAVTLGGEKCRVVVLFSDIRGFTALAESMRPDEVARLLSEYFTVMVECVFRHGGTLDKFIGDALMAQWGAPIPVSDAAERALSAARDMMRALDGLNDEWRAACRPTLEIGIGLNAGEVFAGNIGSARRLEFTVIGDAVNIASRLCAMADAGEILFTDAIRSELRDTAGVCERGALELRGTRRSVSVYRASL